MNYLRLTIDKKSNFKQAIFSLQKKYEVVILRIDGNEAYIRAIDKKHISCIYLNTDYLINNDETIHDSFIIDLTDLYKSIKENYSVLEFVDFENYDGKTYTYINGGVTASIVPLKYMDDIEEFPLPQIEYPISFIPDMDKLRIATKFLSSNSKLGDGMGRIRIQHYSDDKVEYDWINEDIQFSITDNVVPKDKDKFDACVSIYDASELYNILKLSIHDCILYIGNDMPITVECKLDIGLHGYVNLIYILAPRIEV